MPTLVKSALVLVRRRDSDTLCMYREESGRCMMVPHAVRGGPIGERIDWLRAQPITEELHLWRRRHARMITSTKYCAKE